MAAILRDYGVSEEAIKPFVDSVASDRARWVRFMMRFELGLEEPDPKREWKSALTIALSYVLGGTVPIWPYLAFSSIHTALLVSCAVTLCALFGFGAVKGGFTGVPRLRAGLQTLLVGGLAAGAAFSLARLLG